MVCRVAANSAMQRGASRVGCGARVDFSGPFAAACVATPARSFRSVDNLFDSSCKRGFLSTQDVEFPVLRRRSAVYTYAGIPRMSVPVYRHMTGSANQINVTSVYRHAVCNCERASGSVLTARARRAHVRSIQ